MKVLICYASAGIGHRKAAEALVEYWKQAWPADSIDCLDLLQTTGPFFRGIYSDGYRFLVSRMPGLWKFIFNLTQTKPLLAFYRCFSHACSFFFTRRFAALLRESSYDCILSTHFFTSEIAARLKSRRALGSFLVTVVTDFGVHPCWIHPHTDWYVCASASTAEQARAWGAEPERIREWGIPVSARFMQAPQRQRAARKIGIDPGRFTVLISTGSFGIGPLGSLSRSLGKNTQLLVVCAHNQQLYAALKKADLDNVRLFGFVDNMHELMAAADCIIAKPGGLTICECIALRLPPLFVCAIPGQEEENARFMAVHHAGRWLPDAAELLSAIAQYQQDPTLLEELRAGLASVSKPDPAKTICDALRSYYSGIARSRAV